jgi:hypothetical protein
MMAFVHSSQRLASSIAARTLELFLQLRDAMAEARESRRKLEAELFRNRYHISSKNDDDLPIVR